MNIKLSQFEKESFNKFNLLCGKVEGRKLDNAQIKAIINENENNLVIAGAGTGKTTTIVGKIKYLVNNGVDSSNILVLSFTNKSASEMKERIEKEIGKRVDAYTFHKLGLLIVKSVKENINIYSEGLTGFIVSTLNKLVNDYEYLSKLVNFAYSNSDNLFSLKGEKVNFKEEKDMCNFLYFNGIVYNYDNISSEFYLYEYDRYIRFSKKKRKRIGKIIYICESDDVIYKLDSELKRIGISYKGVNYNDIWRMLNRDENLLFKVSSYFETIINLIKSNQYNIDDLYDGISSYLVRPLYMEYEKFLRENNVVDFNDMINEATRLVKDNLFVHNYDYVIVDEYQDISKARFNLLKALRKQKNYNLFCVGDDFQSIYRFSGSDISLITHFDRYWGKTNVSRIHNTYRFSDKLAKISGNFVMKNSNQIRKNIKGFESTENPIQVISYDEVVTTLNSLPNFSTVYMLGRYNKDIDVLRKCEGVTVLYDSYNKKESVICDKRIDLNIEFLTVHKSKGLQADYTFVINNKDSEMGFPSKIIDDEFTKSLLDFSDDYPYAEERRLFYVALTRCKIKCFLVTVKGCESTFIDEINTMIRKV